jgi:hypothetical protein
MWRATLLIFFLGSLAGTALRAQAIRIVMQDGSEYRGVVESESADTVTIRTAGNVRMAVPRVSIGSMTYDRESEGGGKSGGFVGLGFTVGTPGGLNGVLQIQPVRLWGIRLSGGAFMIRGGEVDGVLRFAGTGTKDHNAIIGAGMMEYPDFGGGTADRILYLHAGYGFHSGGFNMMATLGAEIGDPESPLTMILFQIGFVPRAYFGEP